MNGINLGEVRNKKITQQKKTDEPLYINNSNYILKGDDMEEFKVLIECVNTLYREKRDDMAFVIEEEFTDALKKHLYDLGTQVKPTMTMTSIQS